MNAVWRWSSPACAIFGTSVITQPIWATPPTAWLFLSKRKTSIWLALKNPVFKGYWLAALVSGTCVAAHNTAAFSVLGQESDSAILISLMSTLSALPFALFTLPAGALADMAERKKILYGTSLWQASVALCLAILALTDSLSPYIILVSVFLFGIGFAFASPASASVEVEMVPPEHLASANTLGGLQMNIAGIIGPLIGGFLVSLSGPAAHSLPTVQVSSCCSWRSRVGKGRHARQKLHRRISLQQSKQRSVTFATPRA